MKTLILSIGLFNWLMFKDIELTLIFTVIFMSLFKLVGLIDRKFNLLERFGL